MNDFYSAAAQVIPVLLLAMVLESSPVRLRRLLDGGPVGGGRARLLHWLLCGVLWLSVAAEMLALGGLSFDEERFPALNRAVGAFVWSDILVLAAGIAWMCVRTLKEAFRGPSHPESDL